MLSRTTEYALRAIICLADNHGKSKNAETIAAVTKVPSAYLAKVLQILGKGDLIVSQRGVTGGFMLKRSPEELTLLDVVQCVDPMQRIVECPLQIPGHTELCPMHRRIDEATELVEKCFQKTTIAQLLAQGGTVPPLCVMPTAGHPGNGHPAS